jgi:hypothetical protein
MPRRQIMRAYVPRSFAALATVLLAAAATVPAAAQLPTFDGPVENSSPYADPWTPVYQQMAEYNAEVEKAAQAQAAQVEQWNRQNDAAVKEVILERMRQLGNVQSLPANSSPSADPWTPAYKQMPPYKESDSYAAENGASAAAIVVAVLIGVAAIVFVGLAVVAAVVVALVVFVAVRSSRRRSASPANATAAA